MNRKIASDDEFHSVAKKLRPEEKGEEEESFAFDDEKNEELEEELSENNDSLDENVNIEKIYGICERINTSFKLFSGKIKQSPADFMVNEIDLDNQVVRLTSIDLPTPQNQLSTEKLKEDPEMNLKIEKIIGKEIFENVIKFLESETRSENFKLQAPKEKLDRKLIHDFIKANHKDFISTTVSEGNLQLIEISHLKSKHKPPPRDSFRNYQRNNELGTNNICVCNMYKENIDTLQAVSLIAKHLRISPKRIGYAGTKDKKAKTTQQISFFKIEPSKLARLNNNFYNIKLGNFKLKKLESLKLGDLRGNRFKIVIREVDEIDDELICRGLDSLKSHGFVNYFGLQRFGNFSEIPTHLIGKNLILNNVKNAVDLILKPRNNPSERDDIRKAREIWEASNHEPQDASKALALVFSFNCVEKYLLIGLANSNKNDYLGAFQNIPRNMRLMYLHAYQSYVWNMATSKRIQMNPNEAIVGDLVRAKTRSIDSKEKIIVLDETNVNDYSIEDVLLPLPGFNVTYPNNQIKEYYEEVLAKDEIKFENFKNKIKDFSLGGDYRAIIVKPENLQYDIVNYYDQDEILTKSDLDLITENSENQIEKKTIHENTPQFKAIVLDYNLPASSYATMALREILKNN